MILIASIAAPIWAYRLGDHFEYAPVVKLTWADWIFYPVLSLSLAVSATAAIALLPLPGRIIQPKRSLVLLATYMTIAAILYLVAPLAIADELGLRPFWVSAGRAVFQTTMFLWLLWRGSSSQKVSG